MTELSRGPPDASAEALFISQVLPNVRLVEGDDPLRLHLAALGSRLCGDAKAQRHVLKGGGVGGEGRGSGFGVGAVVVRWG